MLRKTLITLTAVAALGASSAAMARGMGGGIPRAQVSLGLDDPPRL